MKIANERREIDDEIVRASARDSNFFTLSFSLAPRAVIAANAEGYMICKWRLNIVHFVSFQSVKA